ncbi:MAG: metal-dependent hydrolase [Gemmatales bacterium]
MAAFREHVTFSTVLGVGYAVGLKSMGYEPSYAILAGCLCGVSGMLPDLDSDSGRPVREMFSFLAAVCGIICFHRLGAGDIELRMLLAGGMYLFIRFGFSYIFKQLTVHRGMCHSIPAALIACGATYLAFGYMDHRGALAMAGGVLIGFLSHLLLDEIYAVDFKGLRPKLNQFAGSALKFFSKSTAANVVCWGMLLFLGYRIAVEEKVLPERMPTISDLRHAKDTVIEKMGWTPATQRGKPVSVRVNEGN